MLTEFLDEIYQPPGPPRELMEIDPDEADLWERSRARYEHVRQSVVEHLKQEYPGRDVKIQRIEHLIPGVLEFQRDPIELNDTRLYRVILDLPIDAELSQDLAAPTGPPESIPPPAGASENEASEADDTPDEEAAAAPSQKPISQDTVEEAKKEATGDNKEREKKATEAKPDDSELVHAAATSHTWTAAHHYRLDVAVLASGSGNRSQLVSRGQRMDQQ
jgi:hypothetical protein